MINAIRFGCNQKMSELIAYRHEERTFTSPNNGIERVISAFLKNVREQKTWIAFEQPNTSMGQVNEQDMKFHDLTDYEYYCNEIYFDEPEILNKLGESVIAIKEQLKLMLTNKYRDRTFCIVISIDEGEFPGITARFHLFRGDMYIDKKLENYDEPILFEIFETGR